MKWGQNLNGNLKKRELEWRKEWTKLEWRKEWTKLE